jgi:hypothetical protein
MRLFLVAISIIVLNVPFGYWRTNVKKFSLQWILAIHLPIPVIIAERIFSGIGFSSVSYPVLIVAFIVGQLASQRIYHFMKVKKRFQVSSCFVMDCYRHCFSV